MTPEMNIGKERGLLSDIEILERLVADDNDCLFISPIVDPVRQLGPSSLDIHLGNDFCTTQIANSTHIDLLATPIKGKISDQIKRYEFKQKISPEETFVLHPGEFTLGSTLEFFRLPLDIAGRLEGRSSYGRLGLQVHATAGFVDPGFEGTLTFELINAGVLPLKISPGLCLGQICFLKVGHVQVGYMDKKNSKYGGALGVEISKIHQELEITDGDK